MTRSSAASTRTDLVAGNFGARGSGKSEDVREDLDTTKPARLLINDPLGDYAGQAELCRTLDEMVRRSSSSTFRLRYVPPDLVDCSEEELAARFDVFCRIAFKRGALTMVVDEAHLYTKPSYAPPAWRACTLMGRHRGIRIHLCSQRPAHVDKQFFSNATELRTGRLNYDDDVQVMARALRVPRQAVEALVAHDWIKRDLLTGALSSNPPMEALQARRLGLAIAPAPTPKKTREAGRGAIGRGPIGGVRDKRRR